MSAATAPSRLTAADLEPVRHAVRALLLSSPSFRELTPEEQQRFATEMVKVSSYLAVPEGVRADELPTTRSRPEPLATAQADADATETARMRAGADPGFAGEDFKAGAVKAGVQQFGELVKKVDFPKFVSGLIEGVFQAIVDSSIQQMRAYGELLANVAKTVDQFARDNISENNARDWLVDTFPDSLGVETGQLAGGFAEGEIATPAPKLTVTAEDPTAALQKISTNLALPQPITDLSDENQELRLVMAARVEMARSRQQLLASMVMLGINRIVVTDGLIHAKVVFDMRASDQARRQAKASMYDAATQKASVETSAGYSHWFSPFSASVKSTASTEHVATVESSVDETSESKAEVKAKLSGEVRVNFKSDYFPMEKLATPQMIAAIQGNSVPAEKPAAAAPAR